MDTNDTLEKKIRCLGLAFSVFVADLEIGVIDRSIGMKEVLGTVGNKVIGSEVIGCSVTTLILGYTFAKGLMR
ncbi:unnamed protein product [Litomosoides sigmodontis]|uniref:Uncharacterized protein n=1 Tax=Litomosoides sigmodontis TaxID=42156 RepID=A0A3P6VFT4_LITSI|nr:unnamed protein product [Litomosoides sigmodontis]